MGSCFSSPSASRNLLENADGNETDYHKRYLEDMLLGQGEFGTVKLVHDVSKPASPALACKILRKGVVFKDNVLLSAIKPHILKGEVDMLRELKGECYCLKLVAIYESPRSLSLVTEYCSGGEMMEYLVATHLDQELRTEDVSRIAFQILSAVNHCSKHHVIHRDIKPENCMFMDQSPTAELRLIDFGSGCLDKGKASGGEQSNAAGDGLIWHTTYAGSAFYSSPEMFQRHYTDRTDVWSVGVTLYVLVAGYPADQLQKAFNILQSDKGRKLRELPNLPNDLPDSFHELLESLLTYRHRQRPSAGQLLPQEFVQFHKTIDTSVGISIEDIAATAAFGQPTNDLLENRSQRTQSVALSGTQQKHSLFLGFKRFERSLTTLLAAMLTKTELKRLLELLHQRIEQKHAAAAAQIHEVTYADFNGTDKVDASPIHSQTLLVVRVNELRDILHDNFDNANILTMMDKLPYSSAYGHFAYHVALLADFAEVELTSTSGMRMKRNNSFSYLRRIGNAGLLSESVGSRGSVQSLVSLNKAHAASRRNENRISRSVQEGNVFAKIIDGGKTNMS
ncbi:hypothetical protein MPSEU_001045300 [Mayamaea pseudoterrestris]|nr:hypothetical protein MPSEU_001045300 [Mayamaea pseudoterrestris]